MAFAISCLVPSRIIGFLRAEPLGEEVMKALLRSFNFAQDDTSKAAIRGILPPFT